MIDLAYAMGGPAGGGAAGGTGSVFSAMLPILLIFLVFYFLMIRPQQKRAREHRDFLDALQKGDEVITSGGIHGRVTGITDNVVTLEIAEKVRVKVQRANIAGGKPRVPEKTG